MKRKRLPAAIAASILTAAFHSGCRQTAQNSSLNQMTLDWSNDTPMDVGSGIDELSEEIRGKCVKFSTFAAPVAGNQASTNWSISFVNDWSSTERSMGVTASAKLRAGIGKGRAKVDFFESQSRHDYGVYALVSITRDSGKKLIHDPQLQPAAISLLQGNIDSFRKKCGDEFFSTIQYGGEFLAVLELNASSETVRQEISKRLSGRVSSGVMSGELSADFRQAIQAVSQQTEVKIRGFQIGGSITRVADQLTVEGLLGAADKFVQDVSAVDLANAAPYSATSEPYSNLLDYPETANYIDLENQREVITDMEFRRAEVRRSIDNIDFVLTNVAHFEAFDAVKLNSDRNKLIEARHAIYKAATQCFNNYTQCKSPSLDLPATVLPKRKPASQFGRHASCGIEALERGSGPVCGDKQHPSKVSNQCPVATYIAAATPACKPKSFRIERTVHCGPEDATSRPDPSCPGSYPESTYEITSDGGKNTAQDPAACAPGELQVDWRTAEGTRCGAGPLAGDCWTYTKVKIRVCKKPAYNATCSNPAWNAHQWKACRHPKHKPETYHVCRDSSHGPETYKECRHSSHGPAAYPTFAHASFGALYKECLHTSG